MVAWVCKLGGNPACPPSSFFLSPWHHAAPSWRAADSHSPTHQHRHHVGACPWNRRRGQIRSRLQWRIQGCFQSFGFFYAQVQLVRGNAGLSWMLCMRIFLLISRDFSCSAATPSTDNDVDIGRVQNPGLCLTPVLLKVLFCNMQPGTYSMSEIIHRLLLVIN